MTVIKRNAVANLAGRIWSNLLSVAFVPLYLHFLGIEAYGLVGFAATLQGVLLRVRGAVVGQRAGVGGERLFHERDGARDGEPAHLAHTVLDIAEGVADLPRMHRRRNQCGNAKLCSTAIGARVVRLVPRGHGQEFGSPGSSFA